MVGYWGINFFGCTWPLFGRFLGPAWGTTPWALGLWRGTTPQAAPRPAPLKGSHRKHKVRYWRPLRGDAPRGGEMSRSDRGDRALFARCPRSGLKGDSLRRAYMLCSSFPAARGLAALPRNKWQMSGNFHTSPGRRGRLPLQQF